MTPKVMHITTENGTHVTFSFGPTGFNLTPDDVKGFKPNPDNVFDMIGGAIGAVQADHRFMMEMTDNSKEKYKEFLASLVGMESINNADKSNALGAAVMVIVGLEVATLNTLNLLRNITVSSTKKDDRLQRLQPILMQVLAMVAGTVMEESGKRIQLLDYTDIEKRVAATMGARQ